MTKHQALLGTSAAALILGATLIAGGKAAADIVFADDVIVQGSLCVGLDCINNENFGFDTLRLKENNTRIKFEDTSVGSFPTNDWQLTANDSISGGASKFSIEDVTGAKVPFTITAGAATNSIFVDSTGRLGLRTATPVLDVHINTSNTPAVRMEQNNSGGFTAQTWDVAGNEANFFVRDVTGGSKLSFRIRPGAPTSSIDIAANGNVGMGTASPATNLDIVSTAAQAFGRVRGNGGGILEMSDSNAAVDKKNYQIRSQGDIFKLDLLNDARNAIVTDNILVATSTGNVGIGVAAPAARLHTTGSVRFAGVTGCGSGIQSDGAGTLSCLASSRQFKNIAGDLPTDVALANVMALRPQRGSFKTTPDVQEHWFIAEEVAAVDPALVGLNDGKPHVVKTQNVVADLVAVVQQQQRQIEELKRLLSARQ